MLEFENFKITPLEFDYKLSKPYIGKDKKTGEEKEYEKLELLSRKARETSSYIKSDKLAVSAGKMEKAARDNNPIALEAAKTDFALDFIELKKLVRQWNSNL